MPVEAAAYWAEYLYRQRFSVTHDEYLDEPVDTVEWLLRIDSLVADLKKREAAGGRR